MSDERFRELLEVQAYFGLPSPALVAYGNQFPAYRENPLRDTLRAVEGLAADSSYARRYEEFQRLMVYGAKVEYAICVGTLRDLAGQLR